MAKAKLFAVLSTLPVVGYLAKPFEFREIGKLEKIEGRYAHTLKSLGVRNYRQLQGRLNEYSRPGVPVATRLAARDALKRLAAFDRDRRTATVHAELATRVPAGAKIGMITASPRNVQRRVRELKDLGARLEHVARYHQKVSRYQRFSERRVA